MKTLLAAFALTAAIATGAAAQGFPNQTVRIVVPFTPGGSNDVVAREIATGLQARFKQPVIVENRPGGGGSIAYQHVAKSAPDGHTLMVAPASFTIGPNLVAKPNYDPVKEFAAVNMVGHVPFAMVVPANIKAGTVKEFIELARTSPTPLSFGSTGPGTPHHLSAELFKIHAKIDLVHVPYKGATAALPDLTTGRIDMFIGAINTLLPLVQDGKLRALATVSGKRIPSLPDLPTMSEAAYEDFVVESPIGIVAPAGTPKDVIETLNREISTIIADKALRERMSRIGVEITGSTAEEYSKFLATDTAKWAKAVDAAGIERR